MCFGVKEKVSGPRKPSFNFCWVNIGNWMGRPGKLLPAEKFRKEGTKNELTVENQLWSQVASVPRNQSDAFRKNPVISLFIWGETSNTLWVMFHGSLLLDLWEDSKIPWALSVWLNPPAVSLHHPSVRATTEERSPYCSGSFGTHEKRKCSLQQ